LVAVGAGRWQVPGIKAARMAGLNVIAVDADSNAQGIHHANRFVEADIRNSSAVIAAISEAGIRPDGAIAFCNEAGMITAAFIREFFDLPGSRTDVTKALTNKGIQRAKWTEANILGPRWFVARSKPEVPAALEKLGGKVIFKPVDSAGSRGVNVINSLEDWENAFAMALAHSISGEVIIEQFIEGVEHTVESFTHRGETHILAVTSKKKVPGTHGTVACELFTAQFDEVTLNRVGSLVGNALAALGYSDGPGHTEFILTIGGQMFLVESAGRGGGFMVADGLVPLTSGFDLARACAQQAVGIEPMSPVVGQRKSVVLRFIPSRPGKVVSISGFTPADEISGVVSEPMVSLGQDLGTAVSDGDRMAFILASGDTLNEATAKADEREEKIRIVVGSE
jgi:biotin carboxylase